MLDICNKGYKHRLERETTINNKIIKEEEKVTLILKRSLAICVQIVEDR